MIKIEKLFHHYGGRPVIRDVSLTVKTGEIVAMMGPNGMGKSTMLACTGGAIVPRGGRIEIDGLVRYSSEEAEMGVRQKVMYLPDTPWIPVSRSCWQWAAAVAMLYRDDERRVMEQIESLVGLFELEKIADTPISSYSTGQKKKAMLVMALAPETPVLILDEPFSGGLDPTGLLVTRELLRFRAEKMGHTILISTPTPELVEETADKIVILKDGVIAASGSLEELKEQTKYEGNLEGLYQRLSSSDTGEKLEQYRQRFRP